MITVPDTELEQKTSEYIHFVRDYFFATGKDCYKSNVMRIDNENKTLILQYKGK